MSVNHTRAPTSPARPSTTRTRSSTLTTSRPSTSTDRKASQASTIVPPSVGKFRSASGSTHTAAVKALNTIAGPSRHRPPPVSVPSPTSPRLSTSPRNIRNDYREPSPDDGLYPVERATLALYTYKPSASTGISQPSPLPSTSSAVSPSAVHFNHNSLPFRVRPGDYLEIRRIRRPGQPRVKGEEGQPKSGGEALKGVPKFLGRDGYVFRAAEDSPNVPLNQIQVPDSVATAFRLQHRSDVEVIRISDPSIAHIDHFELRFSQYLGRADMWRLGMSLEDHTIHVGEKINLAGGAIRAEVHAIWRNGDRYSSGIVTSKSKTIYRSRSAQVYIFIQLCEETWQFDEDGERYYEKVVHSFLPDLFARWGKSSASHLVTIILFGRVIYHPSCVAYMEEHDLTVGLHKDSNGKWCKDFFRVIFDFERRTDWVQALPEIKQRLEKSEKEMLMDFHLDLMESREGNDLVPKRILGGWSFAYDGNVLEAVNLALNPFDEHHIDRDLSRTGLNLTVISPGTGHFAVDKNLLRLTTERMVDHGISLDLVCLTKMPLHSVPLFHFVSKRPIAKEGKTGMATPDLLYFDAHLSSATDVELADCYSIPKWVNASFYSRTADKPFRDDRFIPRCKMYEIQMLGILDHNLTTVTIPLLDAEDNSRALRAMTAEERKRLREDFDAAIFGGKPEPMRLSPPTIVESKPSSLVASYQSARLVALMQKERRSSLEEFPVKSTAHSPTTLTIGWSPSKAPRPLDDTPVMATSPAPSSLSMMSRARSTTLRSASPSTVVPDHSPALTAIHPALPALDHTDITLPPDSGQSTPRVTPGKRLRNQSSRGSFASRFGPTWLFGAFGTRSQPSHPAAAAETVGRQAVVGQKDTPQPAETLPLLPTPRPVAVPGAVEVQPPTPSPSRDKHITQPLPIAARPRAPPEDEITKSLRNSVKFMQNSRSPGDSWGRSADLGRASRHVTVNPCNPRDNVDPGVLEGRRWQHIRPITMSDSSNSHLMKWTSLCAPACLPLTTDYLPTSREISDFYEVNSYEIACFSDQVSFLIRPDVASGNLASAVMREMASQRLTQNFQFIVLPHDTERRTAELGRVSHRKILAEGESMADDLKIGGASEALRDPDSVIYLLLSHHIHRLSCDTQKQSVTVQKFVRRLKYDMEAVKYQCLVWPAQMRGFGLVDAKFSYPNIESKLGFNYLDRLINGDEVDLNDKVQYWRTRYILIPSGKDPLPNISAIMPKGENFEPYEVHMEGAYRVVDVFNKHCLKRSSSSNSAAFHLGGSSLRAKDEKPLKLIPTTWDPSACVLDEGLMAERERMFRNEEVFERGKRIEGMTLAGVGEMMCKVRNGLVIRDRWWHYSFTGEQFCEWLLKTFEDVKTIDQAAEWARELFRKGLIEHVTGAHDFYNYGHFYYRLRPTYDKNAKNRRVLQWFNGDSGSIQRQDPQDVIERHAKLSTSPYSSSQGAPIAQLAAGNRKKKKIRMSQTIVIDLDPAKRSDRAEVAILHADIIHNARNALHFELNWLGVTAGLLDELRSKCAAQAERFGLRFVEAPVEQIKDISTRSAYRAPIPIPLALEPPFIPDLATRLRHSSTHQSTGNIANWFEYKILTDKFGFVLDVEGRDRYPETVEVEYLYRSDHSGGFDYSQFCHRSGLALVQCIGGKEGFLWADNRLYINSPGRGTGRSGTGVNGDSYPMAPLQRLGRGEEARLLREEMERFCNDKEALKRFYDEMTPPAVLEREEGGLDIPGARDPEV